MTRPHANQPADASVELYAQDRPDRCALEEEDRALTWREWNDQADRLAEVLSSEGGVRADSHVAVCMRNRIEWFVCQAAIAKLDAVLVPISYRLTASEIRYIVRDADARAFAFDADDVESLLPVWTPALEALRLVLSVTSSAHPGVRCLADVLRGASTRRYWARRAPRSIVYTSGTTSRPRGVVLGRSEPTPDAARSARIADLATGTNTGSAAAVGRAPAGRKPPPPGIERNLLGAPLNHAAGQASARATHAAGGCVYLMPRFDAETALRLIDREKITMSFLVPTMLNRIVNLPEDVLRRYDVSSIRILTTGASPCPQWVKECVIEYFGPDCLIENYGSTEVGLISRMRPEDHLRKPGSCGRLLRGVQARIVGDDGRTLPVGEVGEIHVRTPQMITHYLNEGTPRELVDGFFATGDLGRFDPDGFLYVVDRKKDMIIAGGVNIYPAEIESVLREHPHVMDACVFGIPHPEWGEEVKAVVERVPDAPLTAEELLAFAAHALAGYKRPRSIEFVEEIPRNPAGKALKAQLRAPYWSGAERSI